MNSRFGVFALALLGLACISSVGALDLQDGTEDIESLLQADVQEFYAKNFPETGRHLLQGVKISDLGKQCLPRTGISPACDNLIKELRAHSLTKVEDSDVEPEQEKSFLDPPEIACYTSLAPAQKELACNCEDPIDIIEKFLGIQLCLYANQYEDQEFELMMQLGKNIITEQVFAGRMKEVESTLKKIHVERDILVKCNTDVMLMNACDLGGLKVMPTESSIREKRETTLEQSGSSACSASMLAGVGALFAGYNALQ